MDALNQKRKQVRRKLMWHPVKLTAMIYLKEALIQEHYEICADVISVAREFGANDREIYFLLEDSRRSVA